MPAYKPTQLGGLTSLVPGDSLNIFDGTETPAAALTSLQFSRGQSPSASDQGTTFQIIFPSAPSAVVLIQASNVDVDADYQTVWTSTNLQNDNYTDTTRWAFYRAKLSTYSSGGMPVVVVKR